MSHLFIIIRVTGTEIIPAIRTRIKLFHRKNITIAFSELPNTFLTPISLVLERAINSMRPNNPDAAITRVKRAKIVTMVLRFLSEE